MSVSYAVGLPTVGEFGDPVLLLDLAVAAEQHGWDGVYLWDHVLFHDREWSVANPMVTIAAIAARTSRLRLIPMCILPRRRPHVVAREVASLSALAPGRVTLATALGSMDAEYAEFGEDPDLRARAAKLDAGLRTLDGLVPLWCAGRWPRRAGLRRAARWQGAMPIFAGYGGGAGNVPPAMFAEAAGYLAAERGDLTGFDLALEGDTPPSGGAGLVAPYVDSGLTWWVEAFGWWRGGVADARARIAAGPPR
jgi:alkanesulfonate monooxygenase SsuD/methylene tetrahydromethanopterin reductase-like flavin-dependent oxidoreductase (luciferase family)